MSQENVEIVRRIYANWAPESSPSESNLLHPDIEWVNPRDALEPGTRRGASTPSFPSPRNSTTDFEISG
jgi:ketosteroid isomerase-like protein